MKIARMIIGIVSIVLFLLIVFQSCAVGIANTIESNGDISGSAGLFTGICMLIAGIVGIAARKSRGGSITAGCFYALGGIIGIANFGKFADLIIWSVLSLIFAAVFIITGIIQKKPSESKTDEQKKQNQETV